MNQTAFECVPTCSLNTFLNASYVQHFFAVDFVIFEMEYNQLLLYQCVYCQ